MLLLLLLSCCYQGVCVYCRCLSRLEDSHGRQASRPISLFTHCPCQANWPMSVLELSCLHLPTPRGSSEITGIFPQLLSGFRGFELRSSWLCRNHLAHQAILFCSPGCPYMLQGSSSLSALGLLQKSCCHRMNQVLNEACDTLRGVKESSPNARA